MTAPIDEPGRHTGRTLSLACVLASFCVLAPEPVRAQISAAEGEIRVIETVNPTTGARYRQAVYDLTKSEIKTVQRALREAGYLGVGWTGQLDHGTVKALGEFQEDRGLHRCDCVSYETIVALGLKPEVQVTTVAVGGASPSELEPHAGYSAGIYYPVGVPVWVPADSSGSGGEDLPQAEGEAPATPTPYPPPGATPPGVRPLPPPTRAYPSDPRSGAAPRPVP